MAVVEPKVENAGFDQGKLVRRDKVPKMDKEGEWYHWKDLNVGMNLGKGVVGRSGVSLLWGGRFVCGWGLV